MFPTSIYPAQHLMIVLKKEYLQITDIDKIYKVNENSF